MDSGHSEVVFVTSVCVGSPPQSRLWSWEQQSSLWRKWQRWSTAPWFCTVMWRDTPLQLSPGREMDSQCRRTHSTRSARTALSSKSVRSTTTVGKTQVWKSNRLTVPWIIWNDAWIPCFSSSGSRFLIWLVIYVWLRIKLAQLRSFSVWQFKVRNVPCSCLLHKSTLYPFLLHLTIFCAIRQLNTCQSDVLYG